jgi:hypothetical protein
MSSLVGSRFFRQLSAVFFIGVGLFIGWPSGSLINQLVTEHGSPEGNLLRIALVFFLLVLSALFFIVGIINCRSSRRSQQNMGR